MISVKQRKRRYRRDEIVQALESFIVDNSIPKGSCLPSTMQLSSQFNVSEKTIHRAMNTLVERNVLYRVRGRGTFVCDHIKPRMMSSIAMLLINNWPAALPELDRLAFDNFFDELEHCLEEKQNCRVKIIRVNPGQDCAVKLASLDFFDCIIASAGWLDFQNQLFDYASKVVLIQDSEFRYGNFNQVLIDYVPGFRKALHYFKELGVKKFFVAGMNGATSHHRGDSLLAAARLEGLQPQQFEFYYTKELYFSNISAAGNDCADYYLQHCNSDCAVISVSDYVAIGLIDSFERRGLRAGIDMPMVSYDNLLRRMPEFADKLTFHSIVHPMSGMIDATVQMCRHVIEHKLHKFSYALTVPAEEFVVYAPQKH